MNILEKFSLKGKHALIASPQYVYGTEIATGLCEAGAKVWFCGEDIPAMEAVAAKLKAAGYQAEGIIEYHQDGTVEPAVALADTVKATLKKLDIFVENGSNVPTTGWVHSYEAINELFQKMQTGLILTVQQLGILMSEQKSGSMIFVSDIHALVGCDVHNYDNAPELFEKDFSLEYGYIKGSYVNYSRQVAGFLGKYGARCNCIAFGPLEGQTNKAFGEAIVAHSHIKRLTTAEDVKSAAVFFASDASVYITGSTIAVDGGYTVK